MKKQFIILIDAGHGIDTLGKCSPDGKHREWAWARELAKMLQEELTRRGYDVRLIVPENTDISLTERARRVNAICSHYGKQNVLLISLHNNAAGADGKWHDARGWCAFTSRGQTQADVLATYLYEAAKTALKDYIDNFSSPSKNQRPIRTDYTDGDPDIEAGFAILVKTDCPAVLTENLFQDNREDCAYIDSDAGKRAIVKLHADGIQSYINERQNQA